MATSMALAACGVFSPRGSLLPNPRSSPARRRASTGGSLKVGRAADVGVRRRGWAARTSPLADDRVELDENPEGIISGEWPDNFSLLTFDDLRKYFEPKILKEKMKPSALLGDVMSREIRVAKEDQTLAEIEHHFEVVSGLPVVDDDFRCIGIISKKDIQKALSGLETKIGEIMSSPPITLSPDKTVLHAAALMLKNKIHRIPVLNEEQKVIGMVTRSDIFHALEVVQV